MLNKILLIFLFIFQLLLSLNIQAQSEIKPIEKKQYYFWEEFIADGKNNGDKKYPSPNVSKDSLFSILFHHVNYPQLATKYKIIHTVALNTTFGKDGKINAIDIDNTPYQLFDTAAVKLLMSTNGLWKPGQIDGKDAEMTCTVLISYNITSKRNKIFFGVRPFFDKRIMIVDSSSSSPASFFEINEQNDTIRHFESKNIDASKLTFVESYGTVTIGLDIDTNGNISELEIVNSVTPKIDSDAIKYLRSTNGHWTPAFKDGVKKNSHKEFDLKYFQYSQYGFAGNSNYSLLERSDQQDMESAIELFDKKEFNKALIKLNKVCKYRIHEAEPFYYRGLCQLNLGNAEKGCEDIKLSMEIAEKYGYPIIMEKDKVIDFLKKSCGE